MNKGKKAPKNHNTGKSIMLILLTISILAILFIFFRNQNATAEYNTAIDQGLESIEEEEYEIATSYFEDSLAIKNEDKKTEALYQNSWLMHEAKTLYIDYEFNESLEKVNQVLETDSEGTELDLLFTKAEELKKDSETILVDQAIFQSDFDEEKKYETSKLDETQVEQILESLNHILAHQQIDEPYHQDKKKSAKNLLVDVQSYQSK